MSTVLSDGQLLSRLVGFDSVSSRSNVPIAEFICDYVDDPRVEIVHNPNHDRSKVNLIIRSRDVGSDGSDRGGLVLSGHLDVVPAPEADWKSDPFVLRETDDAYFGRGACDMKGFVALAVNVFREAVKRRLGRPLVLILTFDEEPGMLGAEHLVKTWSGPFPLPKSAIVGEPTNLQVVRMHRGHLKMRVTVRGKTAHSGYPQLGVNAIEPAAKAMVALTRLKETMQTERHDSAKYYPETPYVSLNLGRVYGGEAINVVPDRCVVEFGCRLLPDVSPDAMTERCRDVVKQAIGGSDYQFEVIGYSPSLLVGEDAPIYRALCEMVGQRESIAVSYATDGGMLQRLNMDCAVFGPGNIEVAHKANEFMPKSGFVKARKLIEDVVRKFC